MVSRDIISSITDAIILSFSIFSAVILVIGCVCMLFQPLPEINANINAKNLVALAEFVLVPLIIFLVLYVIAVLIRKLIRKKSHLTQFKCFFLIGYGGIALCGIVPRISVFVFSGKESYIFGGIVLFSYLTSIMIYFAVLRPNSKHFGVDYDLDGTGSWFWKHFVIHIIVLVVTIRITIGLYENDRDISGIIGIQFTYSIICVPSIFDFCQILRGGVIPKQKNNASTNGDDRKQKLVTENVEMGVSKEIRDPETESKFKLECTICIMRYSETRIPRMLKECGHTVCEGCANELLKKNNQIYLCCPFCQQVTVVKGPANLLPKNYVALEVVENMV